MCVFQREFIQFCKTLSNMFHGDAEESELFQAIAMVTSLVLQIGEAGQRGGAGPEGEATRCDWTVSLAQILASLLTEPALVTFFERPGNLRARIAVGTQRQYQQRAGILELEHASA